MIFIIFARYRARQAGRTPPPISSYLPFSNRSGASQNHSASPGIFAKIRSKLPFSKNSTRSGAYEQPLGGSNRRGLDPDEAWDARVGNEADGYGVGGYYEEHELGLHPPSEGGAYSGGGYGGEGGGPDYGGEEITRGRSLSRDIDRNIAQRYDQQTGRENPFGDQAERSDLRGVSPRPIEDENHRHAKKDSGDSPTERRSIFHENM